MALFFLLLFLVLPFALGAFLFTLLTITPRLLLFGFRAAGPLTLRFLLIALRLLLNVGFAPFRGRSALLPLLGSLPTLLNLFLRRHGWGLGLLLGLHVRPLPSLAAVSLQLLAVAVVALTSLTCGLARRTVRGLWRWRRRLLDGFVRSPRTTLFFGLHIGPFTILSHLASTWCLPRCLPFAALPFVARRLALRRRLLVRVRGSLLIPSHFAAFWPAGRLAPPALPVIARWLAGWRCFLVRF